jgi:MFS family permease
MQFPSGLLADRFGPAPVITGGVVFFSLAAAGVFVAPTFFALLIAAVIIGVGTGAYKTVGINLMSVIYSERKGFTLGIMDTIGMFGGIVAPIVVVATLSAFLPWQFIFLASAIIGMVLAVLFYVRAIARLAAESETETGEDPDTETNPNSVESRNKGQNTDPVGVSFYISLFRDRHFGLFVIVNMLFGFGWGGITSFLPLYLINAKSFSSEFAGFLFSAFFFVGVVQVVTGELSDRFGHLRILFVLAVLIGIALVLLLAASTTLIIVGSTLLVAVGFHGMRPVRDAYFMQLIPQSVGGGVLGLVRSLLLVVTAGAPALVGYISDIRDFTHAMGTLGAAMLLCAFLAGLLFVVTPVDDHLAKT